MLAASDTSTVSRTILRLILGPLETQVMEVLWMSGRCSVREVINKLDRSLAYTTVMTTLDRLYRKNLVHRRKRERAYLYSPRLTSQQWKEKVARDVVAKLLAGTQTSREVLIACLLEAVDQQDALLLREIEKRMRATHPALRDFNHHPMSDQHQGWLP